MLHQMTDAERIAHLEAQIERMKAQRQRKLTVKVSSKGGVSVYGLGRWPVTLYRSQWESLLGEAQTIKDFITDNADALASKDSD